MLKIKEAIIVEGRYDKIKLSSIVDAPVIETNGFRVFSDKEKQNLIREIARKRGIIILTDSDGAGFVIRNFLKGAVDPALVKHCYIPQIEGKEKRKTQKSGDGYLGVEGVDDELILNALKSVTTVEGEQTCPEPKSLTKAELYSMGLTGGKNSAILRKALLNRLGLPSYLSTNAMITALGCLYTPDELRELAASVSEKLNENK